MKARGLRWRAPRLRPAISITLLALAAVIPVLTSQTSKTYAQQPTQLCQDQTHPVVVVGTFPTKVRGYTTQAYLFPRSDVGDAYLQSLAGTGLTLPPKPTHSDVTAYYGALQQHLIEQQQMQSRLPPLINSMLGVLPYGTTGYFLCGRLSPGQYSLVGLERPNACAPATLPTYPGGRPPSGVATYAPMNPGGAGCVTPDPKVSPFTNTYYSYVTLRLGDLRNRAAPAPSGKPTNAPTFAHVLVHDFVPITTFPHPYF